jgi:hypothetical protein
VKPDRITRAFVLAFAFMFSGDILVAFLLPGWPPFVLVGAGGLIALVAALPVFEAFGEEELERVRAEAAAQAESANWTAAIGEVIAQGDPGSAEYGEAIDLAVRISGQLRDLAHAGRARAREAQLRRAL